MPELAQIATVKTKLDSKVGIWGFALGLLGFLAITTTGLLQSAQIGRSTPRQSDNQLNFAGPRSFSLSGANSTAFTVSRGASANGTFSLNVLSPTSLRFFLYDTGYNTTSSTLPTGLSASIGINGQTVNPERTSSLPELIKSSNPLVTVGAGITMVQLTLSTSSSIPRGTYTVYILCAAFLNSGMQQGETQLFKVILSVQ